MEMNTRYHMYWADIVNLWCGWYRDTISGQVGIYFGYMWLYFTFNLNEMGMTMKYDGAVPNISN